MSKGFIKISRSLFENHLWTEEREYSRAEAWIDLIQMARFEAKQEIIQNKVIEVQRGELTASRRFLENRWSWGSSKVSNYLKMLSKLGMINQRTNQGQTIISLVKYSDYNDTQTTNKPQNEPRANHEQTTSKPNIKNIRSKESKEKKREEIKTPPSFIEFQNYALSKLQDVDLEKLKFKYEAWIENGWKTGKGNKIQNWKTTLLQTLPYLKKEKSSAKKEKEGLAEQAIKSTQSALEKLNQTYGADN